MSESDDNADSPRRSSFRAWQKAHVLSVGDDIYINESEITYTVTEIIQSENGTTIISLETESDSKSGGTLTVSDSVDMSPPTFTTADKHTTESVTSITAAKETILTDTIVTSLDLFDESILEDHTKTPPSRSASQTLSVDAGSVTHIGTCPLCDGAVIEDDERAVCTDCGAWSPLHEWNDYLDNNPTDD